MQRQLVIISWHRFPFPYRFSPLGFAFIECNVLESALPTVLRRQTTVQPIAMTIPFLSSAYKILTTTFFSSPSLFSCVAELSVPHRTVAFVSVAAFFPCECSSPYYPMDPSVRVPFLPIQPRRVGLLPYILFLVLTFILSSSHHRISRTESIRILDICIQYAAHDARVARVKHPELIGLTTPSTRFDICPHGFVHGDWIWKVQVSHETL